MRIKITFHAEQNILVLPLSYHHCLQALIYKMIGEAAKNLHNSSDIKSFVFSQLNGEYLLDNKNKIITFSSGVSFSVASTNNRLLMNIMANCLKNKSNFFLMKQKIVIDDIELGEIVIEEKRRYLIKMLSPVTVHKTESVDGKNKTIYLKPDTDEFVQAINNNFKHKASLYGGKIAADDIRIASVGRIREVRTLYKDFSITGYMSKFSLMCSKDQLIFLSDVGLGDKNSQGFGFFEVLEKE